MDLLLRQNGFDVVEIGPAGNTLNLRHLAHLMPLPARAKAGLLSLTGGSAIGRLRLGNLFAVAGPR